MVKTALLSSAYFGPIQWYQKLNRYDQCLIESCDHYIKQTYRNRCLIMTTNGVQALTVPVEKPSPVYTAQSPYPKFPMREMRISDHGNWRHLHWNALMSAYGESPFFDYYADDLRPFFERRWTFLFDFNMAITETVCELLDVRPRLKVTEQYVQTADAAGGRSQQQTETSAADAADQLIDDFRDIISPKHPGFDERFELRPYYQVYALKHGFQPNLSILDLLFNEGNEAILYL